MNATRIKWLVLLAAAPLLAGCGGTLNPAPAAGRLAWKTASTTGKVAGRTTVKAASTTGKLAGRTAVKGGAALGRVTVKAAQSRSLADTMTALAKEGAVLFKDTATGVTRQIPWQQGMHLYAGGQAAQVDTYMKAFRIVRASGVIQTDWKSIKAGAEPLLQPGDIVEVGRTIAANR